MMTKSKMKKVKKVNNPLPTDPRGIKLEGGVPPTE